MTLFRPDVRTIGKQSGASDRDLVRVGGGTCLGLGRNKIVLEEAQPVAAHDRGDLLGAETHAVQARLDVVEVAVVAEPGRLVGDCLLYTSPSPRDS